MKVNKLHGLWILPNPNNKTESFHLDGSNFVGIKLNSKGFFINPQSQYIIKSIAYVVRKLGRIPVVIPAEISAEEINALDFSTIILTGGEDVDSKFSKTNSSSNHEEYLRDLNEIKIVQRFSGKVIGICRGLQIINAAFGGTLTNDIKDHVLINGVAPSLSNVVNHVIKIKRDTMLSSLGSSVVVPSSHHQSIDRLGKVLKVTSYANDIIESVENTSMSIFGFQFHPEFSKRLAHSIFSNFL